MIIPSIDIMDGQTVQLIGGREHALSAGDPRPIAERFAVAGEVAVVDLDAAIGSGSNSDLVRDLLTIAPCRVGGGIRDVATAVKWLDAGAAKVVLGTAATPEVLRELPRERVIAALDARDGEVVVKGWREGTGESIVERMRRLEGLVCGFLVTFVEREGRLGGTNMDLVPELVRVAANAGARVTIAGGVTSAEDIARLDALGADAQVGMALYTDRLDLGDAISAPLRSDRPDGLWPTVVADETGTALGLVYSSAESVREAVRTRSGVYCSRRRGVWVKGETSGARQQLLRIDLDCDRDALRFTVKQTGSGFCHRDTSTCWGAATGLSALAARIRTHASRSGTGSYTSRLLKDPELLRSKLVEEAGELADAQTTREVIAEAADLWYFTLVALHRAGARPGDVAAELDRRAMRVTRRPGDAKPTERRTP
ncbi:MAG TPA: phosphoribosyl-ATP diphosphatase [Phycisphaerales bacterium]|nr:phosphoribosyl-ATP diphosphatase [Phycisphaerales bacterium]